MEPGFQDNSDIFEKVLTVGPDLAGRGGISSVLKYYHDAVYPVWNYMRETPQGCPKVKKLWHSAWTCVRLARYLAAHPQVRIVHLHTADKVSFPRSCVYMRIARRMGRKVVMHMHGGRFYLYCKGREPQTAKKLRQAQVLVALSEKWREYYTGVHGHGNVAVIPNPVAQPRPAFNPIVRDGDPTVHALFLGVLENSKGLYDMLEAIHRKLNVLKGRLVVHIGGAGDVSTLESAIARLGIGDIVVYEGWVAGERKVGLLEKCSVSLLPSYNEGLPISLLEGMAYSHALVSTNVGGIPEILSQENGALLTPGDIPALAETLERIVSDRDAVKAMGARSYAKATPYFPESVRRKLAEMYAALLDSED